MSDEFLSRLREEPRPEFEERLASRLRAIGAEASDAGKRRGKQRLRPLVGAAAVALAVLALGLPPVRATARGFLDLFRVQRVAAVPVDLERLTRLEQGGVDLRALVGSQVEVIEAAEPPEPVASADQAAALAGIAVRLPATLPPGAEPAGLSVARPGAFRVRLDVAKLRSLSELLGAADVTIPDSWQGAELEVHAPPVVALSYKRADGVFRLMQSRGPEVALPDGIELAELGAVGLQLAGMSAHEARSFARSIDWRSTLLVPIPAQGGSFREVEVMGRKGVLVTAREPHRDADGTTRPGPWRSLLLWADDERVYALAGPGHGVEVLEMARSLG
jgi:hypothetical protein